ncbi:hypothetical protein [Actinomadura miaoliensis]|uniref:Uncharacterized protein n=1 Tax=Actinomadura miaoliensis TaxID=430685 RepID=A0ABP7UV04_9ACTN
MAAHSPHDYSSGQIGIDFSTGHDSTTLQERFNPFVAPIAVDAGAVTKNSRALEIARAVYAAFGDLDSGTGLTRGELISACVPQFSADEVGSRINVFISTGMLLSNDGPDRQHQVRYRINDMSAVALLVFGRLDREGGIQEIALLLSRTTREIEDGLLDEAEVSERITQARHALTITTANLLRLVRSRTIEELLDKRRSQRAAADLLNEAKALVTVVADRFHQLMGAGQRLIRAASHYCEAISELWDRLVSLASTRRDFSMLSPEQYRTAAQRSSAGQLSEVFSRTVFDPPTLTTSVGNLIDAVDQYRPRPARRRPPPSTATTSDRDPIEEAQQRSERARARRIATMEIALQGGDEADLTSIIRAAGWPAAVKIVVDVLLASAAPGSPLTATLSTAILTDPVAEVTYVTPIEISRVLPQSSPMELTTTDDSRR